MGFSLVTPIERYNPRDYYGVRVVPARYNSSANNGTLLYNVKFHIYAGTDSVTHIKSGYLNFVGNIALNLSSTQICNAMSGQDSLGNFIYDLDTTFDEPVNMVVVVFENSTITITDYYGNSISNNERPESVWVIPPGINGRIKRLACMYPETPDYNSDVAAGLLMKDMLNHLERGIVPYYFPYDIFGCGRETQPELGHYPLLSTRNIQYLIDKRNGIQNPTLIY
jgi:hypothetical protein